MIHAQRLKNVLADVIVPRCAGHGGNNLARRHVQQVVIGVVAAKAGRRLHEAQLVNDLVASVGRVRPEQQVAFAQSHAAAVSEEIADGHLVRDVRVIHHETGKPLIDRIVPRELARIHQPGQSGGSECLGIRPNPKHGVFVYRSRITQLAHAVPFRDDDLAVFDDGHSHPGDVERLHGIGDVGIQVGWCRSLSAE